jgi:hypothetical protein
LLLFMALSGLPSGAEGQCHLFMYIFFAWCAHVPPFFRVAGKSMAFQWQQMAQALRSSSRWSIWSPRSSRCGYWCMASSKLAGIRWYSIAHYISSVLVIWISVTSLLL